MDITLMVYALGSEPYIERLKDITLMIYAFRSEPYIGHLHRTRKMVRQGAVCNDAIKQKQKTRRTDGKTQQNMDKQCSCARKRKALTRPTTHKRLQQMKSKYAKEEEGEGTADQKTEEPRKKEARQKKR